MTEKRLRTVLVIDDCPNDIAILNDALKDEYRVLAATDHEVAMKILRAGHPPDLILLDIMMPRVDGYQLCRDLKTDESTGDIPVIFVTGKETVEDEAAGFAAGCVDYIVKPVNQLLVRARVKTHIELRLARDDLRKQNDVLRENARLREEVEGIVRHDLKNPLMIILNLPGMLMRQANINDDQKSYLKMIEDAGGKMLEMINRSIDLYKMERETYAINSVPVDALEVIRQIVAAHQIMAETKKLRFVIVLNGKQPEEGAGFWIKGEKLLLYTLCTNLLKNAVEASPGNRDITIKLFTEDAANIVIHNFGAIPESIRDRFFQKFATAGKEHGTGLGAYSSRLIALTLGGAIGFETSEEKGTAITAKLPLA